MALSLLAVIAAALLLGVVFILLFSHLRH